MAPQNQNNPKKTAMTKKEVLAKNARTSSKKSPNKKSGPKKTNSKNATAKKMMKKGSTTVAALKKKTVTSLLSTSDGVADIAAASGSRPLGAGGVEVT